MPRQFISELVVRTIFAQHLEKVRVRLKSQCKTKNLELFGKVDEIKDGEEKIGLGRLKRRSS